MYGRCGCVHTSYNPPWSPFKKGGLCVKVRTGIHPEGQTLSLQWFFPLKMRVISNLVVIVFDKGKCLINLDSITSLELTPYPPLLLREGDRG